MKQIRIDSNMKLIDRTPKEWKPTGLSDEGVWFHKSGLAAAHMPLWQGAGNTWPQAEGGHAGSTCCNGAVTRGTTLHFRAEKPLARTSLISQDAVAPWRPNKCLWLGQNSEAAARRDANRENFVYISSEAKPWCSSPAASGEPMKMQRDRKVFGAMCPNQMSQQGRRAAVSRKVWSLSLVSSLLFSSDVQWC